MVRRRKYALNELGGDETVGGWKEVNGFDDGERQHGMGAIRCTEW